MTIPTVIRRWLVGVAPFIVAACASSGANDVASDAPDAGMASSGECVTGTVFAEGVDIAPRTWVHPMDGPRVELLGELVGNVRLLAGTVVEVCGPGRTPDEALEVTGVTLRQVDGMPASLGTLRAAAPDWVLDPPGDGEPVPLTAVPMGLERAAGQMIWVAGPTVGGRLSVRSYAVLERWR
ncbi:MAG: hypothetical protein WD995_00380 [Gemmatimonadota bacterium]